MSKPELFIIESLGFDDEKKQLFEGRVISQILHLSDKKSIYYYIRTKAEINSALIDVLLIPNIIGAQLCHYITNLQD